VKGVVCISAICTMNRLTDQDRSRLLHEGTLPIAEPIRGEVVLLGRTFLEDLRDHPERFAIERIVRELSLPILFLHGEEDGAVGIEEAETLYHWADKSKSRLVILEKTGHTFGARHPFEGPTKDLEQAAGIASSFLTGTFGLDPDDGKPREAPSGGHPAGVTG
jgi:pimeloyl-ACP methyl ester carboxylesterase